MTLKLPKRMYRNELRKLQINLVKLQRHIIRCDLKILILFEGRDASGKDGTIKRIVEHLSPRETRVVALGKPTEREMGAWYFQRYVPHLPTAGEMVLFNRSWYNRAGVERVLGFCTDDEYETFMETVGDFESLLIRSGIKLLKYYLDVSKKEQERRLVDRRNSPLTQWKVSPVDEVAIENYDKYSKARDLMLQGTNSEHSPWLMVNADNKKLTRLNVIRDILSRVECPDRAMHLSPPDRNIVSIYQS